MEPTYEVVLSPTAQSELRNIYDYLLEEASVTTADHVINGIENEIDKLSNMPESKGLLRGIKSKLKYRRTLKLNYRIIFTINEDKNRVNIVRIDHVKSDPIKLEELP